MFSLNDSMRYFLYNLPTDMRKSFHTLSGIVTDVMGHDPCDGNVYIFINKPRNRIKLLHWEPGGLVLYSKLLEVGTIARPGSYGSGTVCESMEWRDLVLLVEGIIEDRGARRKRLENVKKMRF